MCRFLDGCQVLPILSVEFPRTEFSKKMMSVKVAIRHLR
jgi:hypothetical protein